MMAGELLYSSLPSRSRHVRFIFTHTARLLFQALHLPVKSFGMHSSNILTQEYLQTQCFSPLAG
jgi:hypothetical protein